MDKMIQNEHSGLFYKQISKQDRQNFQKQIDAIPLLARAFSNWIASHGFDHDSFVSTLSRHMRMPCYGHIPFASKADGPVQQLIIFFPPSTHYPEYFPFSKKAILESPTILRVLDWLLNNSVFKEVYLTKDIEEGFRLGFEISTNFPYNFTLAAMQQLRGALEYHNPFFITKFYENGFTPAECLVYHNYFGRVGDTKSKFYARAFPTDHSLTSGSTSPENIVHWLENGSPPTDLLPTCKKTSLFRGQGSNSVWSILVEAFPLTNNVFGNLYNHVEGLHFDFEYIIRELIPFLKQQGQN